MADNTFLKPIVAFMDVFLFTSALISFTCVCFVSAVPNGIPKIFGNLTHLLDFLETAAEGKGVIGVKEFLYDFERFTLTEGADTTLPGKKRFPFIAVEGMNLSGHHSIASKVVDYVGGTLITHPPAVFQKYEESLRNTSMYFPFRFLMLYATAYGVHHLYRKTPVMVDAYFYDTVYNTILQGCPLKSLMVNIPIEVPEIVWPPDLVRPDANFFITVDAATRKRRSQENMNVRADNIVRLTHQILKESSTKPVIIDGTKAVRPVLMDVLNHLRSKKLLSETSMKIN